MAGRLSGQEWVPVEGIGRRTGSEAFSDHDTYTRYDDGFISPSDHIPLGIRVTQITFAWTGSDHIVHALRVKNTGSDDPDSVYVGFCWDFNVSSAAQGNPALGDLVGLDPDEEISFMYDHGGDSGLSPGYIGGKFLFRPLAGHSWRRAGQDPETDARSDVGECLADEGDSTLATGEEHIIPVTLDGSKRALGAVMFAVDWEFCDLYLMDPFGNRIDPQTAADDPRFNYISGPHHKSFLIADPHSGGWKVHIGYLSGPPSFSYHYSATLFDVPYDYGLPMDYFDVYWALIYFGGRGEAAQVDSFQISGDFQLGDGQYFDPNRDPVFVRIGPYTETIPESSFTPCPIKYDCYEYIGSPPGISFMSLYFYGEGEGACGSFDVFANEVDMSEATLHSLVRLAVGQNTGFERILFEDYGEEWSYSKGEGSKAAARTTLSPDLLPGAFTLSQNYPNPFNASTAIDYHLDRPATIV